MGWENRGNGRYYYTKVRRNEHVVSIYHGNGYLAELREQMAECKRLGQLCSEQEFNDRLDAECERDERQAIEAREREIAATEVMLRAIVAEALRQAGYHQHKRQWRKKRST